MGRPNGHPDVTSTQSVADVYSFYAERAHETDWTARLDNKLPNGMIWLWSKQMACDQADLALEPKFDTHSVNSTESGTPRNYSLGGSTW